MEVNEDSARKMLISMGVGAAENWSSPRLEKYLNRLETEIEGTEEPEGENLSLFRSVSDSLQQGEKIVLKSKAKNKVRDEDGEGATQVAVMTPPVKRGRGRPKKVRTDEETVVATAVKRGPGRPKKSEAVSTPVRLVKPVKSKEGEEQESAFGIKRNVRKDGKPGVCESILEILMKGSAKKPVTQDDFVEKLLKKFPDRDPEAMLKTVRSQLAWHLPNRGVPVARNNKGYWVASDK